MTDSPTQELSAEQIAFRQKETRNPDKIAFFVSLCAEYGDAIKLLFRGGELRGRKEEKGWRNVAEHCVMQLAAARQLCVLLGLSEEDTEAICSTSAIHDWKKRYEVTKEMPPADALALEAKVTAARPDLMMASNPDYLAQVFMEEIPFTELQDIQLYLDLITRENDIVPSEDRIAEVESHPRSAGLAEKANGQYWQGVRARRDVTEERLFNRLRARGHAITTPRDIPLFIRDSIQENWQTPDA